MTIHPLLATLITFLFFLLYLDRQRLRRKLDRAEKRDQRLVEEVLLVAVSYTKQAVFVDKKRGLWVAVSGDYEGQGRTPFESVVDLISEVKLKNSKVA